MGETEKNGDTEDTERAKKSEKRKSDEIERRTAMKKLYSPAEDGQSDTLYTHINSKIANISVLLKQNIWKCVEAQ